MRNLLILILLLIIVWWAQRALNAHKRRREGARKKVVGAERMIACDHCGIHIPEGEGVHAGSAFFCSEDHKRLGAKR